MGRGVKNRDKKEMGGREGAKKKRAVIDERMSLSREVASKLATGSLTDPLSS